jgi:hypothetical protein
VTLIGLVVLIINPFQASRKTPFFLKQLPFMSEFINVSEEGSLLFTRG